MQLGSQQVFTISEPSEVAAARRAGSVLSGRLGFNEVRSGQLALVITEAATNIVKHAECGHLLLRHLEFDGVAGVEVIAMDAGPGMFNLSLQMEDGSSTAGTYGVGLGAIKRLTQQFDIYTGPGLGTVLWMVIWENEVVPSDFRWQLGAVCLPFPGEDAFGDSWTAEADDASLTLMVADGLGHGPDAAVASLAAIAVVAQNYQQRPSELLQLAHAASHGTRGAAVAVAQIHADEGVLRFAGIGNIAASVYEDQAHRHLLSHNGIVGSNLRKVQEFTHPWASGATLIAHSDGINTRWDLSRFPGLIECHPAVIAGVLYRDFSRGRDDVSVVVVREARTFQ